MSQYESPEISITRNEYISLGDDGSELGKDYAIGVKMQYQGELHPENKLILVPCSSREEIMAMTHAEMIEIVFQSGNEASDIIQFGLESRGSIIVAGSIVSAQDMAAMDLDIDIDVSKISNKM